VVADPVRRMDPTGNLERVCFTLHLLVMLCS
jgi:hypothetical protein